METFMKYFIGYPMITLLCLAGIGLALIAFYAVFILPIMYIKQVRKENAEYERIRQEELQKEREEHLRQQMELIDSFK